MILALTSPTRTTSQIYDLASTVLAQKVAQVAGVGEVIVGGGSLPAVPFSSAQRADASHGIALDEVRRVDSTANLLRPKGGIEKDKRYWQIQAAISSPRPKNTSR